jgi:hypothetical protein
MLSLGHPSFHGDDFAHEALQKVIDCSMVSGLTVYTSS